MTIFSIRRILCQEEKKNVKGKGLIQGEKTRNVWNYDFCRIYLSYDVYRRQLKPLKMKSPNQILLLACLLTILMPISNLSKATSLVKPGVQTQVEKIFEHWLTAHNTGSKQQLRAFIRENYQADLQDEAFIERHLNFYWAIYEDFGRLNTQIYKVIEQSDTSFLVYLVKEGIAAYQIEVDPAEVLTVEVKIEADRAKLTKSLGLGALVCKLREN